MMRPALHWSQLKHMGRSPAHYRHMLGATIEPTPAMRFGSIVGELLSHTPNPYTPKGLAVFPTSDGKTRGSKAYREFELAHEGHLIALEAEVNAASWAAEAVNNHPDAAKLMQCGAQEQTLDWMVGDRECRGTPDVCGTGTPLVDLKTTADASPERFPWHAKRMGWFGQLAWYWDGIKDCLGTEPASAHLVVVEQKPPHVVMVYDLTDAAIESGRRHWRSLFERLVVCEENNHWPGYVQGPMPLDDPSDDSVILTDDDMEEYAA